jgi:CRP-like cAMP-binding protein
MYILVEGTVEIVHKHADGEEELVSCYERKGEISFFGELGVWRCEPRYGSAIARSPTTVLWLHADDFSKFLLVLPQFKDLLGVTTTSFASLEEIRAARRADNAMRGKQSTKPPRPPAKMPTRLELQLSHKSEHSDSRRSSEDGEVYDTRGGKASIGGDDDGVMEIDLFTRERARSIEEDNTLL